MIKGMIKNMYKLAWGDLHFWQQICMQESILINFNSSYDFSFNKISQ